MENRKVTELSTRSTVYQPSTLREDDLSVEFVLATETSAKVFDWSRYAVVDEVLIVDGCSNAASVPLQDSHNYRSVDDNIGHVSDIRVENNQLVGRLFFDKDSPKAIRTFNKIKNKHLRQGSVGYEVTVSRWIKEGEEEEYTGKSYKGPLKLSKRWILKEYSIVAIPADELSAAREGLGSRKTENDIKEKVMEKEKPAEILRQEYEEQLTAAKAEAERAKAELEKIQRHAEIDAMCVRAGVPSLAESLKKRDCSIELSAIEILNTVTSTQKAASSAGITGGLDESEKFMSAVEDGLMMRAMPSRHGISKPSAGHEQFRGRRLLDIAEKCLNRDGVRTSCLSQSDIASLALEQRVAGIDNTTGSFTNILENIANKSAMKGFAEAPKVWDSIARVGSVSDFRKTSRTGLSGSADLALKAEGAEYKKVYFNDKKEEGSLGTFANEFCITREALINDDTDSFTTIPMRQGFAAARVPEKLLFNAINTPPTLSATGREWFNDTDGNLITEANGLTATNLSICLAKMFTAKGFGEDEEHLEIKAQTLLVHPNNYANALIITGSLGNTEDEKNSGVINPIAKEGLIVKQSPRLTVSTDFFLFANPNAHALVEMLFLNGIATPRLTRDPHPTIDGVRMRVIFDAGIIILEWRSALKHQNT